MRRQAVVNANVTFRLRIEGDDGEFSEEDFCYPRASRTTCSRRSVPTTSPSPSLSRPTAAVATARTLPDYNVKITACMCFSRTFMMQEYYHNSSGSRTAVRPRRRPVAL